MMFNILCIQHVLYISMFDTDEVLSYDLNSEQFTLLLSDEDGLNGPESLVFDVENNLLYVSSSTNNKIIVYDIFPQHSSNICFTVVTV